VPLVAAALGSGLTAAAMVSRNDTGSASIATQQGLLASSGGRINPEEIYDNVARSVVYVSANAVVGPSDSAFDTLEAGEPEALVDDWTRQVKAGLSDDQRLIYPGVQEQFLAQAAAA